MSIDTLSVAKRLAAAGVPQDQAEVFASVINDEIAPQVVTSVDLGNAVDRLDHKIDTAVDRLDAKIDTVAARLDAKIDGLEKRLDIRLSLLQWAVGLHFALSLGILWTLLRFGAR